MILTANNGHTGAMEGYAVMSTPKEAVLMSLVVLGGFPPLLDSRT
jgi:hypothetical protein